MVNIIQNVGVQFFPLLEYQVFECQTSLDLAIKLEALHRPYCFEVERLISCMHYHLSNGLFYVIEQQPTVLVYAINVVIIICFWNRRPRFRKCGFMNLHSAFQKIWCTAGGIGSSMRACVQQSTLLYKYKLLQYTTGNPSWPISEVAVYWLNDICLDDVHVWTNTGLEFV